MRDQHQSKRLVSGLGEFNSKLARFRQRYVQSCSDAVLNRDKFLNRWRLAGSYVRLGHNDHRAAGQATLDAIHPRAAVRSYYPELAEQGLAPWLVREVWLFDTYRPDHFVDVSHTRELKHAALRCHVSQLPISLIEESDEESEAWRAQSGHTRPRRFAV